MKVIRGINRIRKFKPPVVVALGVFDGVHIGHRRILKAAVLKARNIKGTSVVLTFWPHPQRKESLYSLEHRIRLIDELEIGVCIVINFNKKFAKVSSEDFIKNILIKKLRAGYIYIGKNFRFGRNASGGCNTLKEFSKKFNFKTKAFDVIKIKNKAISSTHIRELIKAGKLEFAKTLLMRPVSILGTVVKGDSLGRRLGFATANIDPHHEVIPPKGVYSARIIFENKKFKGICYIGEKPTLKFKRKTYIEVHIFNFRRNIYAKSLEIQFVKKLRDEIQFDSILALAAQVKKDITAIK